MSGLILDALAPLFPAALAPLLSPSDPLHTGLQATLLLIPAVYVLNHACGNVSWVDRVWTTWPVVWSGSVVLWALRHGAGHEGVGGGVLGHDGLGLGPGHDGTGQAKGPVPGPGHAQGQAQAEGSSALPRLALVLTLQLIWSARLTYHTARRGLYNPWSEDYRYPVVREVLGPALFEVVHVVAVAIAQPLLSLALALPVRAIALSPSPLHSGDIHLAALALALLYLEARGDQAMYTFQEAKHALIKEREHVKAANGVQGSTGSTSQPQSQLQQKQPTPPRTRIPQPQPVPPGYEPGFPTHGLYALMRHPNFAAEQGFWLVQGLFGVAAGCGAEVLAPAFALSLLFCASTALTEWITACKYPAYKSYSRLVGQFVPQETGLKWLWTTATGTRTTLVEAMYRRKD